jgi:hypothetical protein
MLRLVMRFRPRGLRRREAARRYGIDPRRVAKMLAFSVPPGYRRSRRPMRPKLDRFTGIIDSPRLLTGASRVAGWIKRAD